MLTIITSNNKHINNSIVCPFVTRDAAEAHPAFVPLRYLTSYISSHLTTDHLHRIHSYHIPLTSVATMVRSKFKDEHPFGESASACRCVIACRAMFCMLKVSWC